ncbi:hypothetical protein K440DRAFT_645096 [Wilcoxina mikolae CBS 423.85]|nr:hypothetical protein K440DRAFT_645096 [Wilcoxina mikolae CBS 423.85]
MFTIIEAKCHNKPFHEDPRLEQCSACGSTPQVIPREFILSAEDLRNIVLDINQGYYLHNIFVYNPLLKGNFGELFWPDHLHDFLRTSEHSYVYIMAWKTKYDLVFSDVILPLPDVSGA